MTSQRYRAAQTFALQGRPDRAVELYAELLQEDPSDLDALVGAAHLSLVMALPEAFEVFVKRALESAPQEPRVRVLQALRQEAQAGTEAAVEAFAQIASDAPESYAAQHHYGRVLAAVGRSEAAVEVLGKAVALAPDNVAPRYALAMAHHRLGQLSDAVASLRQAVDIEPGFFDGWITLVDLLAEAEGTQPALELLEAIEARWPSEPTLYSKRAALALKEQDWGQALLALEMQARLSPADAEAWASLAATALLAGEGQAFAQAVEAFLEHHPGDWRSHHFKAQLWDLADRQPEAIASLRRSHQLDPQQWKPLNDLGQLLAAASPGEAVDVLTEACRLAPAEALEPRYNLLLAYWNAGHKERAVEAASLLCRVAPAEHPLAAEIQRFVEVASAHS